MSFKHSLSAIIAIVATVAICSCKKEEETTYLYLDGYPSFTVDPFLSRGSTVVLTPNPVELNKDAEEGTTVGYYWTISALAEDRDTSAFDDGHFTYTFDKDTIGTFTIGCTAFAKGHYTASATASITLVRAGLMDGSISGVFLKIDDGVFVDDREGQPNEDQEYYYTVIGGKTWMKENLAYTALETPYGVPYINCEAMNHVFGRYYSWEEANKVCPTGWHLPTEAEWLAAAQTVKSDLVLEEDWDGVAGAFMIYAYFNGDEFWEWWPSVKANNSTGFSALSVGMCNLGDKNFGGVTKSACFWTADEYNTEKAIYRYLVDDQPIIYRGVGDKKNFGASVRCVKD